MQQKAVLKLDLHDEKDKKKAMKIVSGFNGIDSLSINMKDGKLTITGEFDPIHLVEKLRKVFSTYIESIGPAKDEKKGNESGKANDSNNKGDDKGNNAGGKEQKVGPIIHYPPYLYQNYPPRLPPPLYYYGPPHHTVEDDPNGCVIC